MKNELKVGAVLSYITMGLGFIILLGFTPIMLRLLGQSEYGLYNFVASIVSYLGLLSFGFGSAYMRYYHRFKVKEDNDGIAKLNGMFLIVFSIIGIIALIAGIILVLNIDFVLGTKFTTNEIDIARILMIVMIINIALTFPASIFHSHITANEKFIFQKFLQLIKVVANPFLILPILLMGYGSVGMVIVTTILSIGIEISNILFCIKKLKIKFYFKNFDFSLMKEITIFASFIFVNMIIDQINWNVDKFLLGRYKGTVAVAIYGLAAQINIYYLSVSKAVSNVFIPRINKIVASTNDNSELTKLFTKIGRIQFMILFLVCSGLFFFGKPFIQMWAGDEYSGTYFILMILIIPVTIPLIQNIGIEIQKAKNMHKFRSWVYLFIAVFNIIISIPLIKAYGGVGAAIGTAIALTIGNIILMNIYYHKSVGLDIKYFWSEILNFSKSLVIPILVGSFIMYYLDLYNVGIFIISGLIYVIIYCLSSWYFGMNLYEKELIGNPIKKIKKKIYR